MRWAEVTGFDAFCEGAEAFPLSFTGRLGGGSGCMNESERVSAAGSISGMLSYWYFGERACCLYTLRRLIRKFVCLRNKKFEEEIERRDGN